MVQPSQLAKHTCWRHRSESRQVPHDTIPLQPSDTSPHSRPCSQADLRIAPVVGEEGHCPGGSTPQRPQRDPYDSRRTTRGSRFHARASEKRHSHGADHGRHKPDSDKGNSDPQRAVAAAAVAIGPLALRPRCSLVEPERESARSEDCRGHTQADEDLSSAQCQALRCGRALELAAGGSCRQLSRRFEAHPLGACA